MDATGNKQEKIIVIQQVLDPTGIGGVSSEFKALERSSLQEEFEFVPVILKNPHKGISLKDISFYYKKFKSIPAQIIQIRGATIDGLNAQIAAHFCKKKKVMLCVHGLYSDIVYYNRLKKFIAKYFVEPLCFRLADGISCVYKDCEKRDIFKKFKNKMLPYVYNRLPNCSGFDINNLRIETRERYEIPSDSIVGIFCGRMSREKGLEFLAQALMNMGNGWPTNFVLLMVGDGDYLQTFQSKTKMLNGMHPRIIYTGSISNVFGLLAASDFFVMPSLHENHSIALLEAIAMKLPIIATDVGGNMDIIHDGEFGIKIRPFDAKDIEEAIKKMSIDSIRTSFKSKIMSYNFDEFSDCSIDSQLKKAYTTLLAFK